MQEIPNEKAKPKQSTNYQAQKVRILLPYSIANIVFIESLPFWISTILGVLGLAMYAIYLLGTGGTGNAELLLLGGGGFGVGILGLAVGWGLLWYRALCGNRIAVGFLYAFYLPSIFAGIYYLVFAGASVIAAVFHIARGEYQGLTLLIGVALALFMAIILLCNVWEKGLWDFVKLNGRCPVCRQWRFGRIKKPTTVTCGQCNTILEFIRDDT